MVDHQRAGWVRVRVPVRLVVMRIFRRKVAARNLNVSASALRRQWAQGKASVAAENSEHHLQCASQSRRRLPVGLRVKRAAREKEGKVPMVNLAGHHRQEVERPLLADQPEVEQLPQVRSAARLRWAAPRAKRMERDNQVRALINPAGRRELECLLLQSMVRDSRSMERKSPKREHLHQGHNNFGAIFTAAPEKDSGAAFLVL